MVSRELLKKLKFKKRKRREEVWYSEELDMSVGYNTNKKTYQCKNLENINDVDFLLIIISKMRTNIKDLEYEIEIITHDF